MEVHITKKKAYTKNIHQSFFKSLFKGYVRSARPHRTTWSAKPIKLSYLLIKFLVIKKLFTILLLLVFINSYSQGKVPSHPHMVLTINSTQIPVVEISGLGAEQQIITDDEKNGVQLKKINGEKKFGEISLKALPAANEAQVLHQMAQNNSRSRFTATLNVYDISGKPMAEYIFKNAFITKLQQSGMNASSSHVQTLNMKMTYESFEVHYE